MAIDKVTFGHNISEHKAFRVLYPHSQLTIDDQLRAQHTGY
jgi:hypothetical protein